MKNAKSKVMIRWSPQAIEQHQILRAVPKGTHSSVYRRFEAELIAASDFTGRFAGSLIFQAGSVVGIYAFMNDFRDEKAVVIETAGYFAENACHEFKSELVAEKVTRLAMLEEATSFEEHMAASNAYGFLMLVSNLILVNTAKCVGEPRIASVIFKRYRRSVAKILSNDPNTDSGRELLKMAQFVDSLKSRAAA